MESETQFQTAVRQLQLKTANNESDTAELRTLLHYYLRYPNLQKALLHHRACNLGTNDLLSNQKKMQKQVIDKNFASKACECCGLLINNQQLSYNTRLSSLNIGLGVHLFFKNYVFHFTIFTLMFLIYSMFAIITNIRVYTDTNATDTLCFLTAQSNGGCGLSPIGAGSKVLNQTENSNRLSMIQSWIGVGFVSFWGLLYILKTHIQLKFIYEMEEKRVSASDFTLMLTHVPKSFLVSAGNQNTIKAHRIQNANNNKYGAIQDSNEAMLSQKMLKHNFNKLFTDYGKDVVKSQLSYEVIKVNVAKPLYDKDEKQKQRAAQLRQELEKRLNVFRSWILQRIKSNKFIISSQKREQYYEQFIQFYTRIAQENSQNVSLAEDNVIFVTLKSSQAMRQIQQRNQPPAFSNFWNLCRSNDFPIEGVKVRKAPYPEEIKWQCVGFPLIRKRTRRFFMWMLTILLIAISLGASIGIAFINKDQINIGVSIGISIVITFFNIGIQMVIVHTSYYQNQYISSREQSMIAMKIGLGQIANSIGVPIIVTLISQAGTSMKQKTWLKSGGLVDDVFFIGLINILVPIVNFFDPWEQYLRFFRWWHKKPVHRLKIHGQKEFNKFYGNYIFDIGYEYAYLIKTSIFTSFFVCMQPVIALFAPIGLLLYYLSTKRNLLYHFQKPNFHFSTINSSVDFILLISLPAFGLGCLLANNFIQKQNQGMSNGTLLENWIIFIIGIGFLIVVPLRIFYCCIKKPNPAQFDYTKKKMLLNTDYDRLNPDTRQAAIYQFKTYLEQLQKNRELPDQAKVVKASIMQQLYRDEEIRKSQDNMMKVMVSKLRVSQNVQPEYNKNYQNQSKIVIQSSRQVIQDNFSAVQINHQYLNQKQQHQ